ncbi:MAG: oligosaccharide flippase family protein [Pseudomonadota bacterium]
MSNAGAPPLANKVMRSAATIAGGRFLIRLMGLVNTLVVARLLTPEDFGLIAIGIVIMQILENVSEVSVSRTVVKFRDAGRDIFDTLFSFSLCKGIFVLAVMAGAAPLASHFYGDDRLGLIFVALGGVALIRSFRNPRFYEFERDLDFSRELFVGVVSKIVMVGVSVGIAFTFRTYWAIILGLAGGIAVEVLLSFLAKPYLPRLSFSAFRKLVGFTGWVSGASALIAVNNKLGPLILGRIVGTAPTGAYYVGQQLAGLVGRELAAPIVRAIYPGLSSMQGQPLRMRHAYLRGAEAMAALVAPAAFGLGFVANDVTTLVLGEGWSMAALVLSIVTPAYGLVAVVSGVQGLAMASGRVRPLFLRELAFLFIQIPILIISALLYGLEGAIWGSAISSLIYVGLQARLYAITAEDHWWRPFWAARRGLLALLPMSAWFLLVRPAVTQLETLPLIVRLVTDSGIGAAIYGSSLLVLWLMESRPQGFETQCLGLLRGRRAE